MISRENSGAFAALHFPEGPEKLASRLRIRVESSPLIGCDGWCITDGRSVIIRLSSLSSPTRQRFTLAHELAHLIMGTKPDILLNVFSDNERPVDSFAAELLLPASHLKSLVGDTLPLDAKCLHRLAKAAHVSETMAACRVAALAEELELVNAAVTAFDENGSVLWTWAPSLKVPESAALRLLKAAEQASPNPHRHRQADGNVAVASLLPVRPSRILFMQLLPASVANQKSVGERLAELDHFLFAGSNSLRGIVTGSLGAFKKKRPAKTLSIDEALKQFNATYTRKWQTSLRSKILTKEGQEFLTFHLRQWCRK